MTNCRICNRERDRLSTFCVECVDSMPDTNTSFYSDLDVAEWAANRAREFERDRINKLIEELKDIAVSLSQDTGEDTDSEQYYAYLISSIIKEYKKE